MEKLRILVVGGGGREHAIAWAISRSESVAALFCAPGNPGTAAIAENLPVKATDVDAIVAAAQQHGIDLVVVGPEEPLARGLADRLTEVGIPVCGPSQAATRIESSKAWAKELFATANIPTARAEIVRDLPAGLAALAKFDLPVVIKADGLAAGKGVVIAQAPDEAVDVLTAFLEDGMLGAAGRTVVIEEFLVGREVSVFAATDGETIVILPPACDYKRASDNDRGPNTGGMGAYAPAPFVDDAMLHAIRTDILQPTLDAMRAAESPMRGFLYAGLMVTDRGPMVIEYNARLGDPETQVVLPLLDIDWAAFFHAIAIGTLAEFPPLPAPSGAAVDIVLASGGYPGPYQTGLPISGLDALPANTLVFHAGTKRTDDGKLVTAGGRVLAAVGLGPDLAAARRAAETAVNGIAFPGCHRRHDIALRELG